MQAFNQANKNDMSTNTDLFDKIKHFQLMAPLRLKGPWIPFFQEILRESGLPRDQISKLFDVSEAALFMCECGGQIHMTKAQFAEYQRLQYRDTDREARIERMKLRQELPEAKKYRKEQTKLYLKEYKAKHADEIKEYGKRYYSDPQNHEKHKKTMREYMRNKKVKKLTETSSTGSYQNAAEHEIASQSFDSTQNSVVE